MTSCAVSQHSQSSRYATGENRSLRRCLFRILGSACRRPAGGATGVLALPLPGGSAPLGGGVPRRPPSLAFAASALGRRVALADRENPISSVEEYSSLGLASS